MQFPVLTFSSGPTNSMRGAAYLTGLQNAIVVDIGGTTTDVGVLRNGFPREASTYCMVMVSMTEIWRTWLVCVDQATHCIALSAQLYFPRVSLIEITRG